VADTARRRALASHGSTGEWEIGMIKIWSELPAARLREQLADIATFVWVAFWGSVVLQLYQFLAGFAGAGRLIHEGGQNLTQGGRDLGDSLRGLPVVGEQVAGLTRDTLGGAGRPLSDFGNELETFILVIATLLALLFALVMLVPWLSRYVPWRVERLGQIRTAHRVVRRSSVSDARVEKVLAMRAVSRLDYATLLRYTPDPMGDFASGRHDRLARAELASVGLNPR
jgi:hypothetical protein